jgi:ABC-type amino acid transport substrate-binding protein
MRVLIMLIWALTLFISAPSAGATPLKVATEGAYPPFNYVSEQGELAGFDVEIAHALCTALQRKCEIVAVAWEDIIDSLIQGEYDMIVASMAKTPAREQLVGFSDHYYRSRSAFVARTDAAFAITPEGLQGKIVSAPVGTVQLDYLQRTYSGSATIKASKDTPESFEILTRGDADVVLSDSLSCLEFLKSEQGQRFDFIGDPLPAEDSSSSAHIVVRREDGRLKTAINKALDSIRLDGTYDRINRKYFPFNIY